MVNKQHPLILWLLQQGFQLIVNGATHIAGGWIDHVYYRKGAANLVLDIQIYSPYYTALDHDAICVSISKQPENSQFANVHL